MIVFFLILLQLPVDLFIFILLYTQDGEKRVLWANILLMIVEYKL